MKRFILFFFTFAAYTFSQESLIKPGENLVIDGIPPVPTSIAEAVGRYTEFRSAALLDFHPTKHEMLIRTRFADVLQIHLVKMPWR